MTQEEKAKAYEQALKMAKEIKSKILSSHLSTESCKAVSEYIDEIIPELRESEDERIRKHLVAIVEMYWGKTNDPDKAKDLAYLEKQKEPHYTKRNALFDKCVAECDPAVMKEVSDEIDEMLEKEQKPNSTEDMYIADEHFYERTPADSFKYKLAEYMTKNYRKAEGPYGHTYLISAETILEMAEEELLKRGVVQKPAEWSEEDELMRNRCIADLGYLTEYEPQYKARYDAQIDWLKSLPLILKKKNEDVAKLCSNEWSEEDEEMRNLIVAIFEINHPNDFFKANELGTTDMRGVHTEEIVSWLKSLRPSWKPSEQEKGALRTAIHILTDERSFPKAAAQLQNILDAFEGKESRKDWKPSEEQMEALNALNCHGDLSYAGQQNQLISLYNDLKKLKGGVAPMRDIDE